MTNLMRSLKFLHLAVGFEGEFQIFLRRYPSYTDQGEIIVG